MFLFSLCCGHEFHKQCASYRAMVRETVKNLGRKSGSASHHEWSSVNSKGAALFWCENGDTRRKGFTRTPRRPRLQVSGTLAPSGQHFSHLVYILLKAKTSSFPFLDGNCEQKRFRLKTSRTWSQSIQHYVILRALEALGDSSP